MCERINKKVIIRSLICLIFFLICYLDIKQQKKFELLRSGYIFMQEENYEKAIENFDLYLEKNNDIYWSIIYLMNDSKYTRKEVQNAKNDCVEKISMNENRLYFEQ